MKDVLEVFLDNEILSCKLRVSVVPDICEAIKTKIWVSCEEIVSFCRCVKRMLCSVGGRDFKNTRLLCIQQGSLLTNQNCLS